MENKKEGVSKVSKKSIQNNIKQIPKNNIPTPPVNLISSNNSSPTKKVFIKYPNASKKSFQQIIKDLIPPEAMPTKKTSYAFGTILILVVLIGLAKFPIGEMLSGNINISISVGIPWDFFVLSLTDFETLPIKPLGLLGDLIIYLILAYIIDIILNLIIKTSLFESKEEKEKHPGFYKGVNKKGPKNLAEKATQKVFTPITPTPPPAKVSQVIQAQKIVPKQSPPKTTPEMLPPKPDNQTKK